MSRKLFFLLTAAALIILAIAPAVAQDEFVFGMVMVGSRSDQGWNQAHYEAGLYIEENVEGARMIPFENLNPVANPQVTGMDVVEQMVDEGAQLIFTTSDEFEPWTVEAAAEYPDVTFIHISGSAALGVPAGEVFPDYYGESAEMEMPTPNFGNVMGEMELGKAIAGCAAALTTETGHISYLGPLINAETRRYVASAYLGAAHCYETYAGGNAEDLVFEVVWIGFWLPTPDTLDPTQVTNTFFDSGADVVISGIDTPEAILVAGQRRAQGENVYAIPYDYINACDNAPDACLGVPYFNWGPHYLGIAQEVIEGTYEQSWDFIGPNWDDLNDLDSSAVGWVNGPALSEDAAANLDDFIAGMQAFETDPDTAGYIYLWEGPINLQNGDPLTAEGEYTDLLEVWYLPLLLENVIGDSTLSD